MHPNPHVREAVKEVFGALPPKELKNLLLLEPLDYLSMLWLVSRASLIITDSGGLQEEAPSFHTPVIVTRESTERPEGIEKGFIFIAGRKRDRILSLAEKLIEEKHYLKLKGKSNPYGDGKASQRIARIIEEFLSSPSQALT